MTDAVKFIEFNIWANRRLAEQVKGISNEDFTKELGGSFPSIRLTLVHLLESDWIWMHRLKGNPIVPAPTDWQTNDAISILNIWQPVQEQTAAIVKDLSLMPDKEIQFITKKGVAYSLPFADIVVHLTNHSTYHRGQIVNMLRMLGEQPVNTDYFIFCTNR